MLVALSNAVKVEYVPLKFGVPGALPMHAVVEGRPRHCAANTNRPAARPDFRESGR